MIEEQDIRLKGFFEEMIDALVPSRRKERNIENAKKSVVTFCYLLVGLRNKLTNSLKLDLGLYLVGSGTSSSAIDTLSRIGITTSYRTIENYKRNLAKTHLNKINEYFDENVSNSSYNINFTIIFNY
jgi:hypothetical protein